MIDKLAVGAKSPVFAGLLFVLLVLSGCETAKTPEEVTRAFWSAMIANDLDEAAGYASADTRALVAASVRDYSAIDSVTTGKIMIDRDTASVETTLVTEHENKSIQAFTTELIRENDRWQVDFQRTQNQMTGLLFDGFFKGLQNLGETLQKQFERQLPLFEKEIESFSKELEKQMEEFGRELEKKLPQPPPKQPDSI